MLGASRKRNANARERKSERKNMANQDDNRIALEELPVRISAYEDKNGYAIIIKADDERIGNGQGKLVDTLLVRIARGDVPKVNNTHAAKVNDVLNRTVEVAEANIDEAGRIFVTDKASGQRMPAADQQ